MCRRQRRWIYIHITDDMQRAAAANIDRGIGKAAPQEDASVTAHETSPPTAGKPSMTDFKPYMGLRRKPGTGCVSNLNYHLFEERYSPSGLTAKSTPAMSTLTPVRSARKSSRCSSRR